MHFATITFILFTAILVPLYYLIPKKAQWVLLLIASCVFYSFAGGIAVFFLVAVSVATYFFTSIMGRIQARTAEKVKQLGESPDREQKTALRTVEKRRVRLLLVLCLLADLGILAYVKLSMPLALALSVPVNTGMAFPVFGLALPLAISFYIFQAVGYAIDVSRKSTPAQSNFFKLFLFLSFFPQLVQGPISRYSKLSGELFRPHRFEPVQVQKGMSRVVWGFCKKLIIADRLLIAVLAMGKQAELHTGVFFWVYALLYIITLYADFSGGIDITIGVAQMLDIELPENFNLPFLSKSVAEFWRRWHITLGTWFRDYVYYPLTLSKFMLGLSKGVQTITKKRFGKQLHMHLATLAIWFLTGLWHGTSWNFIIWGLLNGVIIIVSMLFEPLFKRLRTRSKLFQSKGFGVFAQLRTFFLMTVVMILDCFKTPRAYFMSLASGFTFRNSTGGGAWAQLGLSPSDWILVGVGILLWLGVAYLGQKDRAKDWFFQKSVFGRWAVLGVAILLILTFGAYGIGFDATQFIYNQF